ncbi:MAG: ATP-binding protein [Pyrinomonadaceae bacterium]
MIPEQAKIEPVVFSPNLRAADELANYWMRQAMLRTRREISWIWHERGLGAQARPGELPPVIDKTSDSLDLIRHWDEKQEFFVTNVSAKYLTEALSASPPTIKKPERGTFSWVVSEMDLDDVSRFTLAVGLASAFDASFGAVLASCLNDPARVYPNLMLIQRLWKIPEEVLSLADPMHPMFSTGLLRRASSAQRQYPETVWEQPFTVPSLVARKLLDLGEIQPSGLRHLDQAVEEKGEITKTMELIAYRLRDRHQSTLRIVPLLGNRRSAFRQTAADIARLSKESLWEYTGDPTLLRNEDYFGMLLTFSWLTGRGLFVRHEIFDDSEQRREMNAGLPFVSTPVTIFLSISERRQVAHIDPELVLPFVKIPPLQYEDRLDVWKKEFGADADRYMPELKEMSRRFRYEKETIREICREIRALPHEPTEDDFIAACRTELSFDIGELAAHVEPRFIDEELILPNKQTIQFEEQMAAMQALTKVHYEWGTARAWNEGGITVLFAGPPGTGKTMAAEIMAFRLKLPMYRVDLSQVVNKYIGETEKNLKRIFDAADISDMVLFFDEADSLFGKRTEVSDSRDRYANLEVSYLLERMERFKGLAILATNRKDDLDKAFARRIRHIIDFPVPDEKQRAAIWRQIIPASVAGNSAIDIAFLARQFPLSGGHIRSIVFNACLQSAHAGNGHKELFMRDVLVAVKREYDKMNRSLSLEQLGPYAREIAGLE